MSLLNSPKTGILINGDVGEEHYAALMRRWRLVDVLVQPVALAFTAAPPGSPTDGDVHIVSAGTGVFASQDTKFARWHGAGGLWEFVTPREGWECFVIGTGEKYKFSGAEWTVFAGGVGEAGPAGPAGPAGADGAAGATGAAGADGAGVPTGGTTGQVLAKTSNTDYATNWSTPSGGGGLPPVGDEGDVLGVVSGVAAWTLPVKELPAGGSSGQVLAKSSAADYAVNWVAPGGGGGLPVGGTTGQHLAKNSATDGDAGWVDPPAGGGTPTRTMVYTIGATTYTNQIYVS